ncbi:MAG: cysteine desulfurase family protein [Actinomycetota bacterium]
MVYLDHAATTPMRPDVVSAMLPYFTTEAANPSSLHASGRRARRAVEEARETIAKALDARPSEVVFTGGGTESDNLAVKGIYWARREADPTKNRIITSAIEHHAVLDAVEWLHAHDGAAVTWLPVDEVGRVDPRDLAAAVGDDVALVTVMWANNEVGTIQPIAELAAIAAEAGIPFHTDAVQAVGMVPVRFAESGVDALTISGHKLGGPRGVGALLVKAGVPCTPLLHGGGQERDIRSGTVDTPGVVGLARAVEAAVAEQEERAVDLAARRDDLVTRVLAAVPDAVYNGDPRNRLAGNAHLSFPGCEGDSLLLLLDARGIECATGSACTAGVATPSHVLLAMGLPEDLARGSLRFSLSAATSEAEIDELVDAIVPVVERAKRAGLMSAPPMPAQS